MIQRLRMFMHFLTWCAKGIMGFVFDTLKKLLIVHKLFMEHFNDTKKHFRQSFSFGLLNCILSLFVTFAFVAVLSMIMYGNTFTAEEANNSMAMTAVSLGTTALFYAVAYVSVLYERFLEEYSQVFTILKEHDDVSDLGR
jgi:hypothetical protein